MNRTEPTGDDAQQWNQLRQCVALGDDFEAAWRAGAKPKIEAHLDQVPEAERPALFRDLLDIERELRQAEGEQPTPAEYRDRFPAFAELVDQVFAQPTGSRSARRSTQPDHDKPPTGAADADRNLLFGLLAFQNNFINRAALLAAFNAWIEDKSKPLATLLVEQGALDQSRHDLLAALVREHLKLHDNDPERSLADLSSIGPVRRDLEDLADPELTWSMAHVGASRSADPDATTIGSSSSGGPRFHVLRPYAKGGLGEVFVALDQELHREVALKEIQAERADDPHSRARFVLEAEINGGLEHPGIVPVYSLGHDDRGRPFYAMRFVKGDNLRDAVKRFHEHNRDRHRDPGERSLELRRLLGRFLDVCNAVAYAHNRGVLHRDLKPGNILLGPFGETLIIDWGLAKVIGRPEPASSDADTEPTLRPSSGSAVEGTLPGQALGTPGYMSPEQALGDLDHLGPASDVYRALC